jgi:hypothetical protein
MGKTAVRTPAGKFGPEGAGRVNEQVLTTINGRDPGDGLGWSVFRPVLKPVAPA